MIQSGYNPQGGNLTTTHGMSFSGGPSGMPPPPQMPGLPFDPTAALRERLAREAEEKAYERSMRERAIKQREAMELQARNSAANQERGGPWKDPLADQKAQDQYERSLRTASMRPTGLGAQMIPGMASDPNLLPSRLRPQGSSFQGQMGPSAAGLTPSMEVPKPTSNRGYDYADPYSQALVQQASFGRR